MFIQFTGGFNMKKMEYINEIVSWEEEFEFFIR